MPSYSTGFWVATTTNGSGSGERLALDGDLALLHRLEQRGLRLGRRPVDLVGEEQVGEHGPLPEPEPLQPLGRIEDDWPITSDGIRSGVNCTRLKSSVERRGERLDQQRLGHARHPFEQHVAPHEQRGDQAGQRAVLADDDLADLVAQRQDGLSRLTSWFVCELGWEFRRALGH